MLRFNYLLIGLILSGELQAAETLTASGSIVRMVIGLAIVLMIMAAIAWVMKKTMQGKLGAQKHIKIVDGVSVGTRERVMVLEVADRWLVVGVAAGQVSQIANLPAGQVNATTPNNPSDQAKFSSLLEAAKHSTKA